MSNGPGRISGPHATLPPLGGRAAGTSLRSLIGNPQFFWQKALGGKVLTVGRQEGCDLQIDSGFVSRKHFVLFWNQEIVNWRIAELGSRNGTKINGNDLSKSWQTIKDGDRLEILHLLLKFDLPTPQQALAEPVSLPIAPPLAPEGIPQFKGEGGLLAWPMVTVGQTITVGRKGDWQLNDPAVSGLHAQVRNRNGIYEIKDQNSTNGTYLTNSQFNNYRLPPDLWVELELGDIVKFGRVEVVVGEAPRR